MFKRIALLLSALAVLLVPGGNALAQAGKARKITGTAYAGTLHGEKGLSLVGGDVKLSGGLGEGGVLYRVKPGQTAGRVDAPSVVVYLTKGTFRGTGGATLVPGDGVTLVKDGVLDLKGTGAYKGKTLKGTFDGDLLQGVFKFNIKATLK